MIENLAELGLLIVIVSWLYQFLVLTKKNQNIQSLFILVYMLGVSMIVVGNLFEGLTAYAYFNLVAGFMSLLVLLKIKKLL